MRGAEYPVRITSMDAPDPVRRKHVGRPAYSDKPTGSHDRSPDCPTHGTPMVRIEQDAYACERCGASRPWLIMRVRDVVITRQLPEHAGTMIWGGRGM